MKRFGLCIAICSTIIIGCGTPTRATADNLDSRLAELEQENLKLKKVLRIEALEKENRALSERLNVTGARETRWDTAVATAKAAKQPSEYNARAAYYPVKSEPLPGAGSRDVLPDVHRAREWAGPYLGLHAGMGFGKWPTSLTATSASSSGPTTTTSISNTTAAAGGLAGLHAGYLWQIGAFVFGPELDLSASTVGNKKNLPYTYFNDYGSGTNSGSSSAPSGTSLKWLSTLRGRVGVAAGDWLFFGTGGLASAGLDLESSWGNLATTEVVLGYAAGGGVEYAFGTNAWLRLEYLYYGFPEKSGNSQNSSSSTCNACVPSTSTFAYSTSMSVKPSTNVIRAGLDWRFN